jgi:hypothetical protein
MIDINNSSGDLIAYLIAESRCTAQRAKVAAYDLVAIGLALKGGLITPYQAIMYIEQTDPFRFLGRLPGDNWGQEWAESARRYHEDRKRSAPKPQWRAQHDPAPGGHDEEGKVLGGVA